MNLNLYDAQVFADYKSPSQQARLLTEKWFATHMYCPNCLNLHLNPAKANTKVIDFSCETCTHDFQLKSKKNKISGKITDGAYKPMIEMIETNNSPDFFFMEYLPDEWIARNLFLVPRFFINTNIIEKRTALSITARRKGWVGCNILFSRLPEEGIISIIKDEKVIEMKNVQNKYLSLAFLDSKKYTQRGWFADILYYVRKLDTKAFSLGDMYQFEDDLQKIHPENKHIREKIRQQLQVLRDRGILRFDGQGTYLLLK
ncbi:MAG TPA: DpnI domain-containing protein [Candidatus Micrarchaeota archaeon]|nr:DpnI domain-containing protein [Candidatus Micrarchaeota archaeon]